MPRISTTTCLCAFLSLAGAALGEDDFVSLRVVTYNVLFGLDSNGSTSYEAVGDMVTSLDFDPNDGATGLMPDVVCFQELDDNRTSELFTFRNEFLPGWQVYAPTSEGDGFLYQGILVRPDITILGTGSVNTINPRDPIFVTIEVPGSDEVVRIYNTHLKASGDSASQATRAQQADVLGAAIQTALANGFAGGVPLAKQHVILAGDLNSNNNSDGTLDGIFLSSTTTACCAPEDGSADANFMIAFGVDCSTMTPCCVEDASPGLCNAAGGTFQMVTTFDGLVDLRYGTLSSASQDGTFISSSGRLDYIVCNEELALRYDDNSNGVIDSFEVDFGFVYRSEQNVPGVHTPGQFANGNSDAVNDGSDHRPVVADFLFEKIQPLGGCCIEGDCMVLTEKNCVALMGVYQGDLTDCAINPCAPANTCLADFDNDGDVDLTDFGTFGAAFGSMSGDGNYNAAADFDGDNDVDLTDFGTFGSEFGRTDCLG